MVAGGAVMNTSDAKRELRIFSLEQEKKVMTLAHKIFQEPQP